MPTEPTSIAEEGFLAGDVLAVVRAVRSRYPDHFREIYALNRLLTGAQYQLQAHQESAREMTCAVLFVRSLAHCQAAVILLARGMRPSAKAMIRCALEGLFNLGACAADYKHALAFLDADHMARRRQARYLQQVQDATAKETLAQSDINDALHSIEEKIAAVEAREISARDMARRAGLEDLYLTAYAQLSGAVHSNAGDLDSHFILDESGQRLTMLTEPSIEGLEGPLLMLGETMGALARKANLVFPLDVFGQCEEHLAAFQRLYSPAG